MMTIPTSVYYIPKIWWHFLSSNLNLIIFRLKKIINKTRNLYTKIPLYPSTLYTKHPKGCWYQFFNLQHMYIHIDEPNIFSRVNKFPFHLFYVRMFLCFFIRLLLFKYTIYHICILYNNKTTRIEWKMLIHSYKFSSSKHLHITKRHTHTQTNPYEVVLSFI